LKSGISNLSQHRKATEKNKLLEVQIERLKKELETGRKEYEDRIEAINKTK